MNFIAKVNSLKTDRIFEKDKFETRRDIILGSPTIRALLPKELTAALNEFYQARSPEERQQIQQKWIFDVNTRCDNKEIRLPEGSDMNQNEVDGFKTFFLRTFVALCELYENNTPIVMLKMDGSTGSHEDGTSFFVEKKGVEVVLTNPGSRYQKSELLVLEKTLRDPLPLLSPTQPSNTQPLSQPPTLQRQVPQHPTIQAHYSQQPLNPQQQTPYQQYGQQYSPPQYHQPSMQQQPSTYLMQQDYQARNRSQSQPTPPHQSQQPTAGQLQYPTTQFAQAQQLASPNLPVEEVMHVLHRDRSVVPQPYKQPLNQSSPPQQPIPEGWPPNYQHPQGSQQRSVVPQPNYAPTGY